MENFKGFGTYRTLTRPHSCRPHSKLILHVVEAHLHLFNRILGMAETLLWEQAARHTLPGNGCITKERQDRVIERACGYIYRACFPEIAVQWYQFIYDCLLFFEDQVTVLYSVVAAPPDQFSDFLILVTG